MKERSHKSKKIKVTDVLSYVSEIVAVFLLSI